jgi:hypothetical protein
LNIDALAAARDPCHYAAALQDTHVGHAAEVDQLLCRTVQRSVEDLLQVSEGRGITGCVNVYWHWRILFHFGERLVAFMRDGQTGQSTRAHLI